MKKVFVIIVTYKGKRWYDKCFESLRKSTIPVEIVVVDNTPGDEDAEYIRTNHPDVHLIKTEENLGFGRANNLGMRYALDNGCDYVFLLNQDTWIEEDAIDKLVKIAENHPEYGIVSPMHCNTTFTGLHMQIGIGKTYRNEKLLSDIYFNTLKDIYETNYVNAAAWLLPRKTLETIGGFCPMIFHYGEDDDYINRVLYHKKKIGVCPSSRIVHDTEFRLDDSKRLFDLSQRNDIDVLLDINNPRSLRSQRRYFFRKFIVSWLRGNKRAYDYYKHRYHLLKGNQKALEECRMAHRIKQPNWL